MSAPPLRLIYGGTFDPVHNGHLHIARRARDELGVPVWMLPAADPPHRPPPGASAAQRARMLQLAVAKEPGLRVDARELHRAARQPGVPSWSVYTLREIRAETGPRTPLAWLMGADSLLGLSTWHQWDSMLELAHIVVAERPGNALDGRLPAVLECHLQNAWADAPARLHERPAGWVWRLRQPLQDESASAVRNLIAAGGPWRHWLPPAVADYIADHGLYGCHAPA